MLRSVRLRAQICILVALCMSWVPRVHAQAASTLSRAVLSDQFDRKHDLATESEHRLIVLVCDRTGFDAMTKWARALRASVTGDETVLALADLKGAPRLVHGMIRRGMPRDTTMRILLDWDGAVGPSLHAANEHLVAAAFERGGALRSRILLPIDRVDSALVASLTRSR